VCEDDHVIGPVAIVLILLVIFPVGLLMSGAVASGVFGFFLQKDGEERHEGSELLELNK
jgi:hypothetical protein